MGGNESEAIETLFISLGTSSDQELLVKEEEAYKLAQCIEGVFALEKRKRLPPGVKLGFSRPVEAMLKEPDSYQLYFKYFYQLQVCSG